MLDKVIDRRNSDGVMGLGEHLDELRTRVLWALGPLVPVAVVAIALGDHLMALVLRPALAALNKSGQPTSLQTTGAMEAFGAYFYIAFIAVLVVGGPWILYQLWRFVAPGLYSNERRFAYVLAPLSVVLSVAGALMMYLVMTPIALGFLLSFGQDIAKPITPIVHLEPSAVLPSIPVLAGDPEHPAPGQYWINDALHEVRVCIGAPDNAPADIRRWGHLTRPGALETHLKLDQYVDLFLWLLLLFVVTFQLPVVILLLGWVGIVSVPQLRAWRKFAFAGSIILGAAVSPTGDPLSLAVLQIPTYLLYELGILLLRLLPARRVAGASDDQSQEHDAGGP